jgi:adenine phosphoribosyltransferase
MLPFSFSTIWIVDDVLATGGTMRATIDIVEKLKGNIIGISFLAVLNFLEGEKHLKGYEIKRLIEY